MKAATISANVGAMRERIDIYDQSQTTDPAGSIVTAWVRVSSTWARIKPMSAAQIVLANRDDAERIYQMKIRYRTDIHTNSRVVWRNRNFDVNSVVDPTEQRVFLDVVMREINA